MLTCLASFSSAAWADGNTAKATAGRKKAAKKVSKAIAEEIGDFYVTKQEEVEAPTGYYGVEYTVQTNSGSKSKCEILEPSKLGKVATWGMGSDPKGTRRACYSRWCETSAWPLRDR